MDFTSVITGRKSIRKYDTSRDIPEEVLGRVLEAARLAPSACNIQPCHFIVVRDKAARETLKEAYPKEWFWTAPVIIAGCVDTGKSWKRKDGADYSDVDLAIAMDHLILAAANEGLGSCWIGAFDNEKARKALGVPEKIKVVLMTPLGYPAEAPADRGRKKLEEMVHKNKF